MKKERYLKSIIQSDALKEKKMAFVSGPRQVGKTTLGKDLLQSQNNYFSWDRPQFRKNWAVSPESTLEGIGQGPILFDELHKNRQWKQHLKSLYDDHGDQLSFIVTGSARLDIYRKGHDSLMGRYIPYRLHPFSVAETSCPSYPDQILHTKKISYKWKDLMVLGTFPEPVLKAQEQKAERWSRLRLDRLAFEDTRDVKILSDLNAFRTLLDLIPDRIGSLFSFHSLKEDVGVAYSTVREWVLLSEMLYYGFFIRPYSKKIKRSLYAYPKYYLYDLLQIPKKNIGQRRENLTALHLLKAVHFWTDAGQGFFELYFVRDKEKREVDFLITREQVPWMLIECKSSSQNISPHLIYFSQQLKTSHNYQIIEKKGYDRYYRLQNIRVIDYELFFSRWL